LSREHRRFSSACGYGRCWSQKTKPSTFRASRLPWVL
jgi:hypothetical protein